MRSTNRDISRYEAVDLTEDIQEEFGWKLVHGEVFRPPPSPTMLSVMCGSGTQLVAMAVVTLLFAALGFLSPSNRGSLAVVMIVTWTLFGALAGYVSSRVYASLGGEKWKRNVFLTATLFPAIVFAIMNLLNFFLIASRSSGAVPFGTLMALVALWFVINVPLTLVGCFAGIKRGGWRNPARVHSIPRQIPPIQWYLRPWPATFIGGLLPFATAFLECFFMLNSLFGTKVYYAFGFLALTFIVTSIVSGQSPCAYEVMQHEESDHLTFRSERRQQQCPSCSATLRSLRKTTDGSGGRSRLAAARPSGSSSMA